MAPEAEPHYIFVANGDDQAEGLIDVYDVSTAPPMPALN